MEPLDYEGPKPPTRQFMLEVVLSVVATGATGLVLLLWLGVTSTVFALPVAIVVVVVLALLGTSMARKKEGRTYVEVFVKV